MVDRRTNQIMRKFSINTSIGKMIQAGELFISGSQVKNIK